MAKNKRDVIEIWNRAHKLHGEGKTLKEAARDMNLRADTLMALLYQAVTLGKGVVQFAEESNRQTRKPQVNRSQLIVYRPGRANRDVKRLTVPEPLLDEWGIEAGETVEWTVGKKGQLIGSLLRESSEA